MTTFLQMATMTQKTAQRLAKSGIVGAEAAYGYAIRKTPLPVLLRQSFERMGATYIKLGRFIASMPTVFPEAYVAEFQKCLDQAPVVPFATIKRVIEQQLGGTLATHFAYVDPVPLASASIAQVHAAKLHNGDDVVIKVQKPNVEVVLRTDLNVVYSLAWLAERSIKELQMLSLKQVWGQIRARMLQETDFGQEATNMEDFRAMLNTLGNTQVVVPKLYPQLCSNKILTMQRFFGVSFNQVEAMQAIRPDVEKVLLTAMNTWFASIAACNSFHADLHAGNLMLLLDGRIGFLDFGIVGQLQEKVWQATIEMVTAIEQKNYAAIAAAMRVIGITEQHINAAELEADLAKIVNLLDAKTLLPAGSNYAPNSLQGLEEDLQAMLGAIIKVGKRHGIHFPADFALLFKQLMYFDKFMALLAPSLSGYSDKRIVTSTKTVH